MRLGIACLPGLLIGLALAGCDRQKAAEPQGKGPESANASAPAGRDVPTGRLDRSHAGTPAPNVLFEDGEGRPMRLSVFRGRAVLVNFWATWCAPCVVEMPSLDALARRETGNLEVIAISQDSIEGRQRVTEFFGRHHFDRLEPNLDQRNELMVALGIQDLPTTILYDADGNEVWRMTGMADWGSERTARLLLEADAG